MIERWCLLIWLRFQAFLSVSRRFVVKKRVGYRGFRDPGSPHPNCFRLLPSLATPVPPSSLQTTPECPVLLSGAQSGFRHLLGLIRVCRGGRGSPFRPWWLRDLLRVSRELLLLPGQGWMTCLSKPPKLIPQGGGSHVALSGDHPGTLACNATRNTAVTTKFLRASA